jgi:hypothetical protein
MQGQVKALLEVAQIEVAQKECVDLDMLPTVVGALLGVPEGFTKLVLRGDRHGTRAAKENPVRRRSSVGVGGYRLVGPQVAVSDRLEA